MGGAVLVSAAQSAFLNQLLTHLPGGVDSQAVIGTGATMIRTVFSSEQVPGILVAYMQGIKTAFALTTAASGVAFFVSLAFPWKKVNQKAAVGAV